MGPVLLAIGLLLLAMGGIAGCRPSDATAPVRSVPLWAGEEPDFLTGDVSPDGRYMSDIDWDTGDLELVDLETGDRRPLTGHGYAAGRYAWTSAFSSDGRRLAVSWYDYETGGHALRILDLESGDSRALIPARAEQAWLDPLDWSPSDEHLLVAWRGEDPAWRLDLVSVEDGFRRTLKELGWLSPGGEQSYPRATFSPDGRFVAYDYRPDLERRDRRIYALALDGGEESELTSGPGVDRLLGWLPDGSGILFYGDRSGTADVWRLRVRDGRLAGKPEVVRSELPGLARLGFAGGAYLYGTVTGSPQAHTAEVDLRAGRLVKAPVPVDDPAWRSSLGSDWSPDGRRLAHIAHDPLPGADELLVIRSLEGDVVRELPLSPALHTSAATLRWVTDHAIVLFAMEKGGNTIVRLDPRDGSYRRLPAEVTRGAGNLKFFEVGLEGRTLFFALPPEGERDANPIVARDAESGEERVLATARADRRTLAVSPDGAELAFVARVDGGAELRVVSTASGGTMRTVHRGTAEARVRGPVAWSPDGRRILFVATSGEDDCALWSVAAAGDERPVRLSGGEAWCQGHQLRVHPDGRLLTLIAGQARGEVWRLEGF